jgi:hypothetical protein
VRQYATRKLARKAQDLSFEEWTQLYKLRSEGHSIGTLASLFNLGHEIISDRLRSVGLYDIPQPTFKEQKQLRDQVMKKKGRYADNPFFKK